MDWEPIGLRVDSTSNIDATIDSYLVTHALDSIVIGGPQLFVLVAAMSLPILENRRSGSDLPAPLLIYAMYRFYVATERSKLGLDYWHDAVELA